MSDIPKQTTSISMILGPKPFYLLISILSGTKHTTWANLWRHRIYKPPYIFLVCSFYLNVFLFSVGETTISQIMFKELSWIHYKFYFLFFSGWWILRNVPPFFRSQHRFETNNERFSVAGLAKTHGYKKEQPIRVSLDFSHELYWVSLGKLVSL